MWSKTRLCAVNYDVEQRHEPTMLLGRIELESPSGWTDRHSEKVLLFSLSLSLSLSPSERSYCVVEQVKDCIAKCISLKVETKINYTKFSLFFLEISRSFS